MKARSIVLLGGLLVAAGYFITGKKLKALSISFKSVSKDIKISLPYVSIPVNPSVFNPNAKEVQLQEIKADVFLNGKKVSEINYNTPRTLLANRETEIVKVNLRIQAFAATQTAIQAAQAKTLNVKFVGTMKVDGFNFPFNETIDVV